MVLELKVFLNPDDLQLTSLLCLQDGTLLCRAGSMYSLPHHWGSRAVCQPGHSPQVLCALYGRKSYGCEYLLLVKNQTLYMRICYFQTSSHNANVLLSVQGGDLPNVIDISKPRLYLLQWLKSDRALMMLFNDGTFQVQLLYVWSCCGYSSFLYLPPLPFWCLTVRFQLGRWTSTTITPRSSCAARMRSTCWRTSMRSVCPPRYVSALYSAVDAPQTCGAAWSTRSTCCSRGVTEHLQAEELVHCLAFFFDGFHGPTLSGTSDLLAMSQVPQLHDCGNGFEVQALILSTATAERRLTKMMESWAGTRENNIWWTCVLNV